MSSSDSFLVSIREKLEAQSTLGQTLVTSCQILLSNCQLYKNLSDNIQELYRKVEAHCESMQAMKSLQDLEIMQFKTQAKKTDRMLQSLKNKLQEYHSFSNMLKKVTALNFCDEQPGNTLSEDGSSSSKPDDSEGPQCND